MWPSLLSMYDTVGVVENSLREMLFFIFVLINPRACLSVGVMRGGGGGGRQLRCADASLR